MMSCTSINRPQRRKLWKCQGDRKPARGRRGAGLLGRAGLFGIAALALVAAVGAGPAGLPELTLHRAAAQDFALAGQHFSSAQDAFAQGKYELAAKEFQAAFDITKDPSMLVNIGESWQRAGDGKKALAGYRAYLAAQPQAPDRGEIEGRIQALETALAENAAGTPAAGQTGAAAAGQAGTPGSTTAASPTSPATAANPTASGSTPSGVAKPATTPPVAAQGGPAPTVPPAAGPGLGLDKPSLPPPTEPGKIDTKKDDSAKTDASGKPAVTTPTSGLRTAAWVAVAAAVALATSGAIVGLGAQDRADELRRRTTLLVGNQPPVYDAGQAEAYTTLQSEGKTYNQASIALLCTAGAVAVTAGALFIADYVRRPKTETKTKGSWALLPTLLPGASGARLVPVGGGLAASGSF